MFVLKICFKLGFWSLEVVLIVLEFIFNIKEVIINMIIMLRVIYVKVKDLFFFNFFKIFVNIIRIFFC